MLRTLFRNAFILKWAEFDAIAGSRCLVALVILLGLTVYSQEPGVGIFSCVSAFLVGIGSLRSFSRFYSTPLFLASLGMGISAAGGSYLGNSPLASSVGLALYGIFFGIASSLGPALAWVGLVSVSSYVVMGTAYPCEGYEVFQRGLVVFAGGALQTGIITAFWKWKQIRISRELLGTPGEYKKSLHENLLRLRHEPKLRTSLIGHCLRVSLTLVAGELIAKHFLTSRSYWTPMTIVLILQPDFQNTFTRGLQRCAGTLVGAGFATFVAAVWRPNLGVLLFLVILCAWGCYLFFNVNYGVYSGFITAYIVFLLGLQGLPGIPLIELRIAATLLGGALAMGSYLRLPKLRWNLTFRPPSH